MAILLGNKKTPVRNEWDRGVISGDAILAWDPWLEGLSAWSARCSGSSAQSGLTVAAQHRVLTGFPWVWLQYSVVRSPPQLRQIIAAATPSDNVQHECPPTDRPDLAAAPWRPPMAPRPLAGCLGLAETRLSSDGLFARAEQLPGSLPGPSVLDVQRNIENRHGLQRPRHC